MNHLFKFLIEFYGKLVALYGAKLLGGGCLLTIIAIGLILLLYRTLLG